MFVQIRQQLLDLRQLPAPDETTFEEAAYLLRQANDVAILEGIQIECVGSMTTPASAISIVSRYMLEIERARTTIELVSPFDAAKLLNISERTLWKVTDDGELPRVKIGTCVRYHRDDLLRFIESKK
jgi:excisionase family DNA binding protein